MLAMFALIRSGIVCNACEHHIKNMFLTVHVASFGDVLDSVIQLDGMHALNRVRVHMYSFTTGDSGYMLH